MITYPKLKVSLGPLPLSDDSINKMLCWRNSADIFKWCRQNDLIDWDSHTKWLEEAPFDQTKKMYSIMNGFQLVGVCGFTSIDMLNQRAEFSLYIGTEHQRKGFATDALKLLCLHGFSAYPFNTIWGESFEGNPAMAIFDKVGFKRDGRRREHYFRDGKFIDAELFSIKRGELII